MQSEIFQDQLWNFSTAYFTSSRYEVAMKPALSPKETRTTTSFFRLTTSITFRTIIKKIKEFEDAGYIGRGLKEGRADTFFITDTGREFLEGAKHETK